MELQPARLNHVIIFHSSSDGQDTLLHFDRLCAHLANKMPIIIITCFESCTDAPEGNVLISKPEFTIYSQLTPDNEATRHFGYHRYFIYGIGKSIRTALVYLTDIVGSNRVFVVLAHDLHLFITPLMLIVNYNDDLSICDNEKEKRFIVNENLFTIETLLFQSH